MPTNLGTVFPAKAQLSSNLACLVPRFTSLSSNGDLFYLSTLKVQSFDARFKKRDFLQIVRLDVVWFFPDRMMIIGTQYS